MIRKVFYCLGLFTQFCLSTDAANAHLQDNRPEYTEPCTIYHGAYGRSLHLHENGWQETITFYQDPNNSFDHNDFLRKTYAKFLQIQNEQKNVKFGDFGHFKKICSDYQDVIMSFPDFDKKMFRILCE